MNEEDFSLVFFPVHLYTYVLKLEVVLRWIRKKLKKCVANF